MSAEDIQRRSSEAARVIADAADAAIARLHAGPSGASTTATARLGCRRCGHVDDAPIELLADVATCDQCGARIAFGRTMPRIIVEPTADPRFVCVSIDGVLLILDRAYGSMVGRELAAFCELTRKASPDVVAPSASATPQPPIGASS